MTNNYFLLIFFPVLSFVLNLIITPLLIRFADHKGFHDTPGERKIHNKPITNIGGIGFFISSLISLIILSFFIPFYPINILIAFGFLLIHLLGIIDDRFDIRARYKLILQIIAAVIIVSCGIRIKTFDIPFIAFSMDIGFLASIVTVIWIVAISNAVNLIDGLDGQAGGISFIALLSIAIVHLLSGSFYSAIISFVLAASVLPFLMFNFPPAKIFMGDGGSLFLGFAIAVLPLLGGNGSILPLLGPLTIIMIPVLDVLASIIRRRRKRIHFFTPDQEHTHHKLLDFGFSNRQILSVVYSLTSLFAVISIYWCIEMSLLAFFMVVSSWISGALIFVILDNKYEKKIRAKRRLENIRLIS